tara:strand:- start:2986 stop:3249 length:264 start_codon:yes stop_codon:yes gene_type:complete
MHSRKPLDKLGRIDLSGLRFDIEPLKSSIRTVKTNTEGFSEPSSSTENLLDICEELDVIIDRLTELAGKTPDWEEPTVAYPDDRDQT